MRIFTPRPPPRAGGAGGAGRQPRRRAQVGQEDPRPGQVGGGAQHRRPGQAGRAEQAEQGRGGRGRRRHPLVRPPGVAPLLVDVAAVRLGPALAGPDAPLQRPGGVGDVEQQGAGRGLDRDALQDRVRGQRGQRRAQRVAARVTEEHPGPAGVPRQEGERARGHRRARRDQEPVVQPPAQAGVDQAGDQGVRPGNAVDAVHEVEGVHEPGDPRGAQHDQQRQRRRRARPGR